MACRYCFYGDIHSEDFVNFSCHEGREGCQDIRIVFNALSPEFVLCHQVVEEGLAGVVLPEGVV